MNTEAWGYYDDENDITINYIFDIEMAILPNELKNCDLLKMNSSVDTVSDDVTNLRKKIGHDKMINVIYNKKNVLIEYDDDDIILCNKKRRDYILSHQQSIVDKLVDDITNLELSDYIIAGVALFLARSWIVTPIYPNKLNTHNRGFILPSHLSSDFPQSLKKIAYHASLNQLNEFDNHERWSNTKLRKQALLDQINLFQ